MISKKEPRTTVLYVRITKDNREWVAREAKKLGYSVSEFMDKTLEEIRTRKDQKASK